MRPFYVCIIFSMVTSLILIHSLSVNGQTSIEISAQHAIMIDQHTGEIIYAKEANTQTEIASLTKILTAIVAIENGKLDDVVSVSERAIHTSGSSIYLQEQEKLRLEDLLYGLMLRSGNDAAVAIAEHIGGSVEGFTFLMNEKLKLLGLQQTHFSNPHGLDEAEHLSTAYDVAKIMQYSMENSIFREIAGAKSFQSEVRTYQWNNKNRLLTELYEHCIAGKTGFTKKAGRTLVTSAKKDNQELIVVTLNASDDWNDHARLYEWAFHMEEEKTVLGDTWITEQSILRQIKYYFMQMMKVTPNG